MAFDQFFSGNAASVPGFLLAFILWNFYMSINEEEGPKWISCNKSNNAVQSIHLTTPPQTLGFLKFYVRKNKLKTYYNLKL